MPAYSNIKDVNELKRLRAEAVANQSQSSSGGGMFQSKINAIDAQLKSVQAAPKAAPKPVAAAPPPVVTPMGNLQNTFAQQAAAAIAAPPPVPTAVVPPAVETVIPPPIAGTPAPPVGGLATAEAAPTAPQLGDAQARVDATKPGSTPATTATNAIADALKKRKVGFAATQFTGEGGVQGLLGRVGQRRSLLG